MKILMKYLYFIYPQVQTTPALEGLVDNINNYKTTTVLVCIARPITSANQIAAFNKYLLGIILYTVCPKCVDVATK